MRTAVKTLVVDVALVLFLLFVTQDLQWRAAYAASPHYACVSPQRRPLSCIFSPSYSFGPLIQFFTMNGNGERLVSPPTFSWAEAIVIALVVVNAWFAWRSRASPGRKATQDSA